MRNVEDGIAAHTGSVDFETGIESALKTIEPYITEDIAIMDVQEMIDTYVGFSHPHVSQRPKILDILET